MTQALQAGRIVLVDDESFMLKLLAQMFKRLGYTRVVSCASGHQGLEQLGMPGEPVELVVLDINMPGMDGVEFIRRLVDCEYRGGIMLVSGESDRILESVQRLIEARQLNALGCLHKPVAMEELSRLLERWVPQTQWAKPARPSRRQFDADQLQSAIANNELVNYYQPQVELLTGAVCGVETLVRWQTAQGAIIYPDQFITSAEEQGLIGVITRTVMIAAMKQARAWRLGGQHLNVAINVSMKDLAVLDFPDEAAAMASYASIEPQAITLEVTESQIMNQLSTVLDVLSRLRLKRFRLSIDDFGTGHSSLAQLRDLPFDELKIDRGFVHEAATHPTQRAICSASLRMAQQLGMQVVAEGIETAEDWALQRELGCNIAQGYFVARPMPAGEIIGWIAGWNAQREHMRVQQA